MKATSLKSAALAMLPVALFAVSSCSPTIPTEQSTTVKKSATSTTVVDAVKASATVNAVDATTRKLKLTLTNGKQTTVTCGPEVRNFNQIHVNDRIIVTQTEEIAAYLDKGEPTGASGEAVATLSPLGAKPGMVMANTERVTVKVTAIDAKARKVTFKTKEGNSKTLKVGDHINLAKVKVGDSVTIRQTEAVAITVEKP